MTKILKLKSASYEVNVNENGVLTFFNDKFEKVNAGGMIAGMGGVAKILERCIEIDSTWSDYVAEQKSQAENLKLIYQQAAKLIREEGKTFEIGEVKFAHVGDKIFRKYDAGWQEISPEKLEEAKIKYEAKANKNNERVNRITKEYNDLLAKYENQNIPTTYDHICIILRYLRTKNWGLWGKLPAMSIGYTATQYDSGNGEVLVGMKLDEPISELTSDEDEEGFENKSKFMIGSPKNRFNGYVGVL